MLLLLVAAREAARVEIKSKSLFRKLFREVAAREAARVEISVLFFGRGLGRVAAREAARVEIRGIF